ncbi:hypothetical protein IWQ60_008814 [Tieghemiomyces parasiticus]|uniref:C2H2-type domain-containing protein n=1 Tax=Tieghemiomyces parasiticus TaxID=78921 RepID=A0A9W7ZWA3_9FUNG|nr:hypothetical protein IWQ60_008814 [Tieghemiomyces parasiticus]
MVTTNKKKGKNSANRDLNRKYRTRRRTKDLDQIHEDLDPAKAERLLTEHLENADDLPGGGVYYCFECARHFVDERCLTIHQKTRAHRLRLKRLKEEVYTQKEAEAAVGLYTDNGPRRSKAAATTTMAGTTTTTAGGMAIDATPSLPM